ncbi:MAG: transposase [Mesorhizobium sp.]|nr:MAG: transposase [Mesorhizobium sp.]RWN51864.1 MAG: transposase [Mesorhizobium sp.]TIO13808.1 MAG: transposase [Mesorhizobium sp.]TIR30063.1 MAG: transposase [Mesorhizobium sp.]
MRLEGFLHQGRQPEKNDAADAEAIVEAAQRPTMRSVEPKTEEQQSRSIMFRTREQLVNQRTELVNALRAHLCEFGHIAPQGICYLNRLECFVEDEKANLPDLARKICRDLLDRIYQLTGRIDVPKKKIDALSREAEASRRLQTMPGVGPHRRTGDRNFRASDGHVKCGRDFAAWLGPRPVAEIDRRQATTRKNLEDGPMRYSTPAYH